MGASSSWLEFVTIDNYGILCSSIDSFASRLEASNDITLARQSGSSCVSREALVINSVIDFSCFFIDLVHNSNLLLTVKIATVANNRVLKGHLPGAGLSVQLPWRYGLFLLPY
ncbi:MAG: hypothetical protein AMR96_05300 [Candidatus Adiutrix intracellularis]|jgi:hypothetical protein|nr:MAG: hypothetical protein AMR96_05300 [Candidatus Adiutrix intracellularis]